MQIKATRRYHFTPVRIAITNKLTNKWGRMWKKRETSALLVGMQIGAATVESSMEGPQKIKNGTDL